MEPLSRDSHKRRFTHKDLGKSMATSPCASDSVIGYLSTCSSVVLFVTCRQNTWPMSQIVLNYVLYTQPASRNRVPMPLIPLNKKEYESHPCIQNPRCLQTLSPACSYAFRSVFFFYSLCNWYLQNAFSAHWRTYVRMWEPRFDFCRT